MVGGGVVGRRGWGGGVLGGGRRGGGGWTPQVLSAAIGDPIKPHWPLLDARYSRQLSLFNVY